MRMQIKAMQLYEPQLKAQMKNKSNDSNKNNNGIFFHLTDRGKPGLDPREGVTDDRRAEVCAPRVSLRQCTMMACITRLSGKATSICANYALWRLNSKLIPMLNSG